MTEFLKNRHHNWNREMLVQTLYLFDILQSSDSNHDTWIPELTCSSLPFEALHHLFHLDSKNIQIQGANMQNFIAKKYLPAYEVFHFQCREDKDVSFSFHELSFGYLS